MASTLGDQELESLLGYLKRSRGFDFTGYKRASLARRIQKRMSAASVASYADYADYLEENPDEFAALFDTILINVTHFFRDDEAWQVLSTRVLPELLARKPPEAPVRVWSAACASGEEACTLAMVLAELMGPAEYQARVKIYATDVDDGAMSRARQATYTEREVAGVPQAYLDRYFERADGQYVFRKEFRRQVIFGRHNLIQDAPISRVDVIACRNTLMYFNAETQARILSRLHYALNDGGILFLGRAETLPTHSSLFAPVDVKRRISMKVPQPGLNARHRLPHPGQPEEPGRETTGRFDRMSRLRDIALDQAPIAQLVVDADSNLVFANARARAMFNIAPEDLGRPLGDLRVSWRPVDLPSLLEQVAVKREPLIVRDVEWRLNGSEPFRHDLRLIPVMDTGDYLGASMTFAESAEPRRRPGRDD